MFFVAFRHMEGLVLMIDFKTVFWTIDAYIFGILFATKPYIIAKHECETSTQQNEARNMIEEILKGAPSKHLPVPTT